MQVRRLGERVGWGKEEEKQKQQPTNDVREVPMEAASGTKKGSVARLHERDRELLGHLAVVRYLSTEQIAQLVFPGRHITRAQNRLRQLMGEGDALAYVRRLTWRTFDGAPQAAWTLADAGYVLAEQVVGPVRVPARDVSAQFMEHMLALNQLYVRLLSAGLAVAPGPKGSKATGLSPLARVGAFARAVDSRFRWVPSDAAELPWTEYDQRAGKRNDRVIRPDAVLELPRKARRLFIECEMGTHAIVARNDEKAGATIHKLERYAAFVNGVAEAAGRVTFYGRQYADRWQPELVFLVQSPHRADSVKRAIGDWRRTHELGALQVRVDVVDSLATSLVSEFGVAPAVPAHPSLATAQSDAGLMLSQADFERLRAFCTGAVATLKSLRDAARARRETPPAYPPHADVVIQLLQRLREDA